MVTDPIADFINQLKNAGAVNKTVIAIPYSALKENVAEVLKEKGYIKQVEKKGKKVQKTLEVTLVYENGEHKIKGVKRVSKPGRRVYRGAKEIFPVRYGHGTVVFSTPKGVLTGDDAKKAGVGGEVLFEIW